jgi:5-methylcytosine-specific restriction endonuclease McrBC regulatory subunit McrC
MQKSQSIKLRDNRFGKSAVRFAKQDAADAAYVSTATEELDRQEIRDDSEQNLRTLLKRFGQETTLADLETKANGGLVLLDGSHVSDKSRKTQSFFKFIEEDDNGSFRLETGNLMGVLRFRNKDGASVQVEVLSRFDKGNDNFFLNYLLSKAFNCAIGAESVLAERSPLLELLLDIVFVRRLGEAAKAGLLRHYREFRNNDWNFKGSLDLARHIRENIPLMHGIAYRKREIDLDVPVNRMILMAALTVNRRHPGFFESNADAADALRELRMGVTEERDLRAILSRRDCREPVRHPFFREVWEPLRRIARMILEDERWTLFPEEAADDADVSGVVFDGSWLWEEYVATVLKPIGFRHCVRGESGHFMALRNLDTGRNVGPMIPDFIQQDTGGTIAAIADAKYKRAALLRDDRLQMIAYAAVYEAKRIFLVYPPFDERCERTDSDPDDPDGTLNSRFAIRTMSRPEPTASDRLILTVAFDHIPQVNDFSQFSERMESIKTKLIDFLKKLEPSP